MRSHRLKFYIISLGTLLVLPFCFWWISHAANDLLSDIFEPTRLSDTKLEMGEWPDQVWREVLDGSTVITEHWVEKSPSVIVKLTRLLLILTIALAVTMILYNGMIYIIQTWQWKEWKNLIKNVILIVVGILVALFSVIIINLIQSIPNTLDQELVAESDNKTDNYILEWEYKKDWNKLRDDLKDKFDDDRFDRKKHEEAELKRALTEDAKKYFGAEWIEPYTGANWEWKVRLHWSEVDMIESYLSDVL